MSPISVKAIIDVYCHWHEKEPKYRAFVNHELFTERTWIWDKNTHLEEEFVINAPPGVYEIKYELVNPEQAQLVTKNLRLVEGKARIMGNAVEIYHEH